MHEVCAEVVRELDAPLITCEAVIAESCYLLRNLAGAPEVVLENVIAGIFQVPFQLSQEAAGVKQILRKYRDRRIDLADACLIRLAEEFETGDILSLDKDFAVYRWARTSLFAFCWHSSRKSVVFLIAGLTSPCAASAAVRRQRVDSAILNSYERSAESFLLAHSRSRLGALAAAGKLGRAGPASFCHASLRRFQTNCGR